MKTGVCWGVAAVGFVLVAGCSEKPSVPGTSAPDSAGSSSVQEPSCVIDADKDGFCSLFAYNSAKLDCNDADPAQFPGAPEALNGVDDNCDGQLDEGLSAACPLTLEAPASGCEKPVQLMVGYGFACELVDSGRVFCWGKNVGGVLGTPDIVNATLPVAVPGVTGATRLASGAGAMCALAGADAICWGAGSAFPFTVPLPPGTAQIALAPVKDENNGQTAHIYALDDLGQTYRRRFFALADAPLSFSAGDPDVKQLVDGGGAACTITTTGALRCNGGLVASAVDLAQTSSDGSLCYKSAGELYCGPTPTEGTLIAGNGSATGLGVGPSGTSCVHNAAGKLVCQGNGPTDVADASQVGLGNGFGCVLRTSGITSCWGNADGGALGNGQSKPVAVESPVNLVAGPEMPLPPIVLLGASPLGACDTPQDFSVLVRPERNFHNALAACKEQCVTSLDTAECFKACAKPEGLTGACFACFADLAACTGADCYAKFQTCAGYPVDFAPALTNEPRFECVGAGCFHGATVGQPCTAETGCFTGNCSGVPQGQGAKVCAAADGTYCNGESKYCGCGAGHTYCGGCSNTGRIASGNGTCFRSCQLENYCAPGNTCRNFSDGSRGYCFWQ
jgi:hypothetical protein